MNASDEIVKMREAYTRAGVALWAARDVLQSFDDLADLERFGAMVSTETADTRAALAAALVDDRGMPQVELAALLNMTPSRLSQLVKRGRKLRRDLKVSEALTLPIPPPLALAIVTNGTGVLVVKRRDAVPPWSFPATAVREGESLSDCVTRNVPRETGIEVTPKELLGKRFHPRTGWAMHYVSASPTSEQAPQVLDTEDLVDVRYMPLDEVLQVMPDMMPAVKMHLLAVLGGNA